MGIETDELARAIGARVRQERKGRELTLDELAERSGLSRRMLVNVEHGSVNPSIGTLLRLSEALGVGLPSLVELPASRSSEVTRNGTGAVLWSSGAGGRGVLVSAAETPDIVELWDWTLAPGDRHESEAHTAGTRELLHVLSGSMTVECGHETHELDTGDALSFHGDLVHAYANTTSEPARFSLTVYEPGIGSSRRSETAHGA